MTEKKYESEYKAYIRVSATFYPDGRFPLPTALWWEDGRRFDIERVSDIRQAVSMKAGGTGVRYLCQIHGKETCLFFEDENRRWFVERKAPRPCAADTASTRKKT